MKEPVLVILAGGMGSRYGGLKQIDTVGTNGESIIDFSIYDAREAGFKKVVLIIRREHEAAFDRALANKIRPFIEVEYAFQDMNDLPNGFVCPTDRVKPWGTTHALLALRNHVDGPFMIINADDYYGKDSYRVMYDFLKHEVSDEVFGMVGYRLSNTISKNGSVTRAICDTKDGYLDHIVEIRHIRQGNEGAEYESDGVWKPLEDGLVSMNYWGFTPRIFDLCEGVFEDFLKQELAGSPLLCEHVIPTAIGTLLQQQAIKVKMLQSASRWFGVTYKEDKPEVMRQLAAYKEQGLYPFDLWK